MLSSEVNDTVLEERDNGRRTLLARYEDAFYRLCGGGAVSSASSGPSSDQVSASGGASTSVQAPRMKENTFIMHVLERFYRLMVCGSLGIQYGIISINDVFSCCYTACPIVTKAL